MSETGGVRIRKRQLGAEPEVRRSGLDLAAAATLAYSSEDPAHPVENLVDGRGGPGGTRWRAAQPNTTEQIVVELDRPQTLSRLVYEVEEREGDRTQEVRIEASSDGGKNYSGLVTQEYNFSRNGANFQREELRIEVVDATHVRLTVVPNKNGSGTATLTTLQLFA
jgi:hypothetical protein